MKQKFRLYRRKASGRYYAQDNITGQQQSLGTTDRAEAIRLLCALNEADYQPAFNGHLARTYLSAGDPEIAKRNWQWVMDVLQKSKTSWSQSTRDRYVSSMSEKALDPIRKVPLIETRPEHFLNVIQGGTVSTNIFLRRLHGFAVGMKWLPWPVLTSRQWPRVKFKARRGITWEEHQKLLARENDPEKHAFFELLWHVGAAQIDMVSLTAENVDWSNRTICYSRRKTGKLAILHFGDEVAAILRQLPSTGSLFPKWSKLTSAQRSDRFHTRCETLGIDGVCMHSYRYAWAERAAEAGYPERYAQQALGHASAAIHRAYAKKARVEVPPLEEFEKLRAVAKVIPLPSQTRNSNAATNA
jgi:integrase